jgi:methionyl-tRNA synthetase
VHFIGKDNIVFHTLIFPALLMAHNRANEAAGPGSSPGQARERWVVPADVPANEFLNLEGRKLSTSRGWAVWATEAAEAFPVDSLRYALATMLPETKDADFSWAEFQARVNGELADVVGNFVHRAVTFARRFAGGEVPPLRSPSDFDLATLAALADAPARVGAFYEGFRFREAVFETVALARVGTKYFNDAEPWKTRASDPQAALNTIHVALQLCATLAVLLEPVTPAAAGRLRAILRMPGIRPSEPAAEGEGIAWDDAGRPLLAEGHQVGEPDVLFPKVEDEQVAAQRELLETRSAAMAPADAGAAPAEARPGPDPGAPYAPAGAEVSIDQFAPLDLRVGRIVAAEPHPKADRLLRFDVDMGYETRQILSGVRDHVTPEEMVGLHVVVVANLAPRTIRGLESRGMILYAENRDGRLVPVVTEGEPGAVVK